MTLTGIVLKPRMVLRTTASVSNHQLTLTKSRTRLIQVIRRHLKIRLKRPLNGSIPINQQRKRNTKRNRKSLKALHYQFFKRWVAVLQVQEVCQTWEEWAVCREEHLQQLTQQVDQPSKKLIKFCLEQ